MEVNKGEAERCRDMGAEALRSSNFPRAIKLLQKSLQLYPLPGVEALLSQTKARMQESENTSSSSQPSSNNNAAQPPPQRANSTASVASSNTQMGKDGRAYTQDQVTIVNQVLKAKEGGRGSHYRVLGNISQDSNETQIKKAYRKLSLKVHPDKNSAPHADEAFKAVGLAYGVLSDPQKRTIYDRYGEEDPDNRGGGGGGFGGMGRRPGGMHMHQGQDVSPEEIFNMFFGGGGMPGMHTRGGGGQGFHFSSNGFGNPGRRPRAQPRQQEQGQQEQQAPSLGMLFQFLPILLIMLVSFFKYDEGQGMAGSAGGSMPGENRYFSLTHKQPFNNPLATRLTAVKEIPYFVSDKFLRTYHRDRYQLAQVERMVEKAYEQYLVDECKSQRLYRTRLVKAAQKEENPDEANKKMKLAEEFELSRCTELGDLFPKRVDKQGSRR